MAVKYFDYMDVVGDEMARFVGIANLKQEIETSRKNINETPRLVNAGARAWAEKMVTTLVRNNGGDVFENFADKINFLKEKGKINETLAKSLHDIRKKGNEAAHGELVTVSEAVESMKKIDYIFRLVSYRLGNKKQGEVTDDEIYLQNYESFGRKLIYIQSGDNSNGGFSWYEGKEKIGDASVPDDMEADFSPNSDYLRQSAERRISSYMRTAGIPFQLHWAELAYSNNISTKWFRDHQVHEVLRRSGYQAEKRGVDADGRPSEWFKIDVETAKKAIKAVKEGKSSIELNAPEVSEEIKFRPEQLEAIEQTKKIFKTKDKMLWNAKMRFGKTLSTLQLAKESQYEKVLILTHRPVVSDSWFEDFKKLKMAEAGYKYGSKQDGEKIENLVEEDGKFVYFASLQDLRGSEWAGGKAGDKNHEFKSIQWDFVIFDEAHEGTQTDLAENVIKGVVKEDTKVLELSGTPFNLFDQYDEDNVFTWDYTMEQQAKQQWEIDHPNEANPYESLPMVSMFTFDVPKKFAYRSENKVFNFKEFFRVEDKTEELAHKTDVIHFLDYISKENEETQFPFSTEKFRNELRHTLWLMPGVKEVGAFAKVLKEHKVFKDYTIINVVEDGDSENASQSDLDKVRKAIGEDPSATKTITLTVRKLTTGVNVPEWTGVVFLSNTESPTTYLQAAFRAQTPFSHENLGMKKHCYVFDFAPDRALKVVSQSIGLTSKKGKLNSIEQKEKMNTMLNFMPILGQYGNRMQTFNVDRMMSHLKRAYAEKAMRTGFEDTSIYNDNLLLQLDQDKIKLLNDLKKIIGTTGQSVPSKNFIVSENGFDSAEDYGKAEKKKRPKQNLTEEQKKERDRLKEAREQRLNGIKVLRGVSIRIPMMIYGMEAELEKDITIKEFIRAVDETSWKEFMPAGITKDKFVELSEFYDEDVFIEAGKMIRLRAKSYDDLDVFERTQKMGELFATFKNPDKETVLTPWRVVNLHVCSTLGGYTNFDDTYQYTTKDGVDVSPRFVETDISKDVWQKDKTFLEPNSKTGLYPLFVATSLFYKRQDILSNETAGKFGPEDLEKIWCEILEKNIYVLAKTPMAKRITERTLTGYKGRETKVFYIEDLVKKLKDNLETTIKEIQGVTGEVKFDAVVGNPPYQENTDNNRDTPLYHLFMEMSYGFSDKVCLITPARFLFNAGQTPNTWNKKMLNDNHFKVVKYWQKSGEVFPNTDIKGGVSITYRDVEVDFGKIGTFTNYEELNNILHKVIKAHGFRSLSELLYGNSSYKFTEDVYIDYPDFENRVTRAERKSVGSNAFSRFPEMFHDVEENGDIGIYGRFDNERTTRYLNKKYVNEHPNLEKYKVFVPGANGSGAIGEVLSTPLIGEPLIGHTQTFISFGAFDDKEEAENLLKYLKTKFSRTMLGTLKITQNNKTKEVWSNVPLQDFTQNSDIDWSQSIPEIDQQLYQKYGLSDEEVAFIEEKVKEMM